MKTKFRLFIYGALLKGQAGAVYMPWNNLTAEEAYILRNVKVAYFEMPDNDPAKNQPSFYPGITSLHGSSDIKGKLLTFSFDSARERNAAVRVIDEFEYERRLMPDRYLTERVVVRRGGKRFHIYLVRMTIHLPTFGRSRMLCIWHKAETFHWPDIHSQLMGKKE